MPSLRWNNNGKVERDLQFPENLQALISNLNPGLITVALITAEYIHGQILLEQEEVLFMTAEGILQRVDMDM
jgi:hypothetical protein